MRFAKFLGQTFLIHFAMGSGIGLGAAGSTFLVLKATGMLAQDNKTNETPTPKDNS